MEMKISQKIACVVIPPIECFVMGLIGYYFYTKYTGDTINFGLSVFWAPAMCILLQIFSWSHLWAFTNKSRKEGVWEVLVFLFGSIAVIFVPFVVGSAITALIISFGHTNPLMTFTAAYIFGVVAFGVVCYVRGRKIMSKKENQE